MSHARLLEHPPRPSLASPRHTHLIKYGVSVAHIQLAAYAALDANDRYADTGKSKTALKE